MTIAATTFTRFDAIGVREQLANTITNVAPTETPFLSNAKKGKAKNTLFEWQTDTLAAASSTNQQLEGDDITSYTAVVPTVRLTSYCEIAYKTLAVSDTQEEMDTAGRSSEVGYQVIKLGKELKRDMETSLLANKAAAAGSTTVARKTAGLKCYIKTNYDKDAGGAIPTYTTLANDTWDDGTQRAFTETIAKNVLQQCYTSGANVSTIMVGPWNKQVFSGFSGVVELMANQGRAQATIIGAANTYVSDFGTLSVIPNRFMPARDALFLDWDMVQVNYLRPFRTDVLAKTGDAHKRFLVAEYGLQVSNEKGLGIACDLATS